MKKLNYVNVQLKSHIVQDFNVFLVKLHLIGMKFLEDVKNVEMDMSITQKRSNAEDALLIILLKKMANVLLALLILISMKAVDFVFNVHPKAHIILF